MRVGRVRTDYTALRNGQGSVTLAQALVKPQVDQGVNQRIEISNRRTVPNVRALDTQSVSLAVNPLYSRALFVDIFVDRTLTIERIAQASAWAGGHGNRASPFRPFFMLDRTSSLDVFWKHQRTDILAALMFNDGDSTIPIGELKRHG